MRADTCQDHFSWSVTTYPSPPRQESELLDACDFPEIPSANTNTDTLDHGPDDWGTLGSLSFTDSIDNLTVDTQMR